MSTSVDLIPPGPTEKYNSSQDILSWMVDNFRQFGNIYRASLYGSDAYVVSDPEFVDHILRANWQNYRKGQANKRVGFLLGNGLMVSEGDVWKAQRRMIQPAFHQEAVGALTTLILKCNDALLTKWKDAARDHESVNVTRDVSLMVLEVVLRSIFGDDYGATAEPFGVLSGESARNLQFAQTFRPLGDIVLRLVAERRQNSRMCTDILGMLMETRDRTSGNGMSDRQLVSEIMTLIVAGHETTASVLNWTWFLLSQHAEVEEKLADELKDSADTAYSLEDLARFPYARQILEEAMRLYPPGWLMTRRALKDDRLGDFFVPAGTEIYISPYLIQRNPALWDDPDHFNPDRFEPDQSRHRHPMAMLPFSAGPRKCIGELFSRIEMQLHLITITKQIRLRCADAPKIELEAGVNLRNKFDFIMAPEFRPAQRGHASLDD
jgi:cytochrome P450